jgi:hypothetical protein
MREVIRALMLMAAFALLTSRPLVEAQKPRAERPTYTLGERWIRSDGVYDLIRVEDGRYIFAAGVDRQIHLTQDLMVAKVQKGQWVMEFTPPPKLTWPLEVGKWGTSSGTWQIPARPGGGEVSFTWSVQAYEDVQVAAGTFKAFRISLRIDAIRFGGAGDQQDSPFPRSRQFVTWYAPEVRQFVKAEGFGLNLLAFQVVALERPAPALLQVALQEPTDQARFTTQGIVAAGKVTGGKGVSWISATLNGAEVSRQEERQAPRSDIILNLPITLREGEERDPRHGRRSGGEHRSGGPRDLLRQANAISIPASPCPRRLPRSPA